LIISRYDSIFAEIKNKMETRSRTIHDASTASTTATQLPDSPATKKLRRDNELASKHKLVKDLFGEHEKCGAKVMGLILSLVSKYNKAGYLFITEISVKHYIKKLKQQTPVVAFRPSDIIISTDAESLGSLLSISPDCSSRRNKGGHPLGTSQELKAALLKAEDAATTKCAQRYKAIQDKGKACGSNYLKRGTLATIIKKTEN
jgi:hypothetical protein